MANRENTKADPGNFFEDFHVGQEIIHPTPRTLTRGDVALYTALYGSRFAVQSSDAFAQRIGFKAAPVDDLLVFHVVFGKTVPDISLNAVANLGYADCRFGEPVFPGDTLSARSRVIGLKENSNARTGVVYVRTTGVNQDGRMVVEYVRWVMINKRRPSSPAPEPVIPDLPEAVAAADLMTPAGLDPGSYDRQLAGSAHVWDDYQPGEKIDHVGGMTVEEAEHMMAAHLYQNTARVHFDQHAARDSRFGRRIVYGGHVISIARALSFNGLANAFKVAAINGGRHVAPVFAGDTVYAWTEVLAVAEPAGPSDQISDQISGMGALRLRTVAAKDQPCGDFPGRDGDGKFDPSVVLELDYWVLLPRRT